MLAVVREIWRRAVTVQPHPDLRVTLLLGLAAFVLVTLRTTWTPVRMLCTMIHEIGHALVGVLSGRRLSGIRLHSDTSGLTVTHGKPRGVGMVATLAAGYPAPAVAGVGAAVAVSTGHALGLLWLIVAVCILLLIWIRNVYGLLVVLVVGGLVGAASWFLPAVYLSWLAVLLAWLVLLGGPRPLVELARRHQRGSDVDQLARLTHAPRWLWLGMFWIITLAAVAGGGYLLVRPALA